MRFMCLFVYLDSYSVFPSFLEHKVVYGGPSSYFPQQQPVKQIWLFWTFAIVAVTLQRESILFCMKKVKIVLKTQL